MKRLEKTRLNKEFLTAAGYGDLEGIKKALAQGADINAVNASYNMSYISQGSKEPSFKYNALTYAAERGDVEVAEFLIAQGIDKNFCDQDGNTPLMHAVLQTDMEMVDTLLAAGVDTEIPGTKTRTPLFFAATYDDGIILDALLQAGANPNAISRSGGTPLRDAVESRTPDALQALLDAGADVNLGHTRGMAPLTWVFMGGKPTDPWTVEQDLMLCTLLDAGADPNIHSSVTGTPPLIQAVLAANTKTINNLLGAGADINFTDADGRTALIVAAQCGLIEAVRTLLAAGADPNLQSKKGRSALMYVLDESCEIRPAEREQIVHQLVEAGADIYAKDHKGLAVSHFAAQCGIKEVKEYINLLGFKKGLAAPMKAPKTLRFKP